MPSSKGILRPSYLEPEIKILEHQEIATYSQNSNNVYLNHERREDNIKIEETVIVNSRSGKPWFASKKFSGVREKAKPIIYKAIEKMNKKTNGAIYRTSPDSDIFIVNALRRRGRTLTDNMVKSLKEIEVIVITQQRLLNLD